MLGITPAVGIGIVTSVTQLRRSLVVGAAINVAGAVVGEMVFGPVAVEHLQSNVRTVHTRWVVQSQIFTINSDLHGGCVRCRQSRHAPQHAAHYLRKRVLAVDIQCSYALPGLVVWNVEAIVVGRRRPSAFAAITDAH